MSNFFVIGGANGSGKTTVSLSLLPSLLEVFEYVKPMRSQQVYLPFTKKQCPCSLVG